MNETWLYNRENRVFRRDTLDEKYCGHVIFFVLVFRILKDPLRPPDELVVITALLLAGVGREK